MPIKIFLFYIEKIIYFLFDDYKSHNMSLTPRSCIVVVYSVAVYNLVKQKKWASLSLLHS